MRRTEISETAKLQSIEISLDLNHPCVPQGLGRKKAVYPVLLLPPKLSPAALPCCFRGTALAAPSSSPFIRFHHGLPFSWHTILSTSHHLHPGVTRHASAACLCYQSPVWFILDTPLPRPPRPPLGVGVHSRQSPLLSGNRPLCSSLDAPLKTSLAVLPTKI